MAVSSIEERLLALEEEVARLKIERRFPSNPGDAWWKQFWGTYKDDPVYEEAMRLGREWRESQPIPTPDTE